MKVIIAGSRTVTDLNDIIDAVEASGFEITEVIEGGARGADRLGRKYAQMHSIPFTTMNADWSDLSHPDAIIRENAYGQYDAKAGHRRNEAMGAVADAVIAVWDGKSTGTKGMVNIMRRTKKQVYVHTVGQPKLF